MNNLQNQITEIIHNARMEIYDIFHRGESITHDNIIANQILDLPIEGYEVEEECPTHQETSSNAYVRFVCSTCNGTGKVRRPAILKDLAEGKEIRRKK